MDPRTRYHTGLVILHRPNNYSPKMAATSATATAETSAAAETMARMMEARMRAAAAPAAVEGAGAAAGAAVEAAAAAARTSGDPATTTTRWARSSTKTSTTRCQTTAWSSSAGNKKVLLPLPLFSCWTRDSIKYSVRINRARREQGERAPETQGDELVLTRWGISQCAASHWYCGDKPAARCNSQLCSA